VLTSESEYLCFISFSNLPKSLFIFSQFALKSQSLSRINPGSKSVIIVGGDFNLGHMDWETLSVFPGKPNQKQHQQFSVPWLHLKGIHLSQL
jgi:hypothetical protein